MSGERRRFLACAARAAAGVPLLGTRRGYGQAPALVVPEAARPQLPYGVVSGDVAAGRAIVWSRSTLPARMLVEWSTTESFRDVRRVLGPAALEDTGFTARVDLSELPAGQAIFYRVSFQSLSDLRVWSEPVAGRFRTPAASRNDLRLVWTADTVGQGWGINREWGGLKLYDAMRWVEPDVFVHCGDTIYADQPLSREVTLDDGSIWRNELTEAKSKVAESLDEFRGNHLYNMTDEHLRRFNASVSQVVLWDDHEVRDNWHESDVLEDPRYREKSVALLAARAKRALFEHTPMRISPDEQERVYRAHVHGESVELFALDLRSYRGVNSQNRQPVAGPETAMMGPAQLEWLKARLAASRATWKVIASDMPIGVLVPDRKGFESFANGNGPALGRELEVADLLRFLKQRSVRNVVWITGDVHYCAAHHYHPDRAQFREFLPFWEFVAGPAHAGTFGPNVLDDTFGPEQRFIGIPPGMKPNRPPSAGLQFFGTLSVDGRSQVMTARLHNLAGDVLYTQELSPER